MMRVNVRESASDELMVLVKGNINVQWHQYLQLLSEIEKNYCHVMTKFMALMITSEPLLATLKP